MEPLQSSLPERARELQARPCAGAVLDDGAIVEVIFDLAKRRTAFVVARGGDIQPATHVDLPDGTRLVPLSAQNNLLQHDVVLLPSSADEYGSKEDLLARVLAFLHRFVDVSPLFEQVVAHYVLLSWLHDAFDELPYLRVRGEPGSGKTRLLRVVGSLCYRPIFASGASTVSPLFRILDSVRGTLILDEADFRYSDERAEITKILNNGNAKGFPVLRSETVGTSREFNPKAFHVFGPKILASRSGYDDRALETRFLSEQMGVRRLRGDVPIVLPVGFADEARALRNQLLRFRLLERRRYVGARTAPDPSVAPRINQVFGPLLALVHQDDVRRAIIDMARQVHGQARLDRAQETDALVLRAVFDLWGRRDKPPSIQQIARHLVGLGNVGEVSARWVGDVVRRKLGLRTERHTDGYGIAPGERERVRVLAERLGVVPDDVHEVHDVHAPAHPTVATEKPRPPVIDPKPLGAMS